MGVWMKDDLWKRGILRKAVMVFTILFMCYFLVVTLPPLIFYLNGFYVENTVAHPPQQMCTASSVKGNIPKVVHQTWKSKNLPEEWQAYRERCKKLNPGYEFRLWSDDEIEDLIKKEYPWFLSTYRGYSHGIQRPDSARYFILEQHGGIYIDCDISCNVPFDTIFKNVTSTTDAVLAATVPVGITNNMMAGKAHNSYFKVLIHDLIASNRWYVTPHWTVMMSAGPLYVYYSYLKYPCKSNINILSVQQHATFFDHDQAATWHNWDGPMMIVVDRYHKFVIGIFILCLIISSVYVLRKCGNIWSSWKKTDKKVYTQNGIGVKKRNNHTSIL